MHGVHARPVISVLWFLLACIPSASTSFCHDSMATNFHPQADNTTSAGCEYSCTELSVFFKARGAIEAASLPSCTILLADAAPNAAPLLVGAAANEVIAGNPLVVDIGRRLKVTQAHAALRYIRLKGLASATGGGGVEAQSSSVTLFDCILEQNVASSSSYGGAILASASTVTIQRSVFRDNVAFRGGAIAVVDSTLIVDDSQFLQNTASEDGGAVLSSFSSASNAVQVALRYVEFAANSAGPSHAGDSIMLAGVSRWAAVNVSYSPFDALRTVETQGMALVSCDETDYATCAPGHGCTHGTATLYCTPCQPNLASADGFECELCSPGYGPSVIQDACVQCPTGLYSSHGICIGCGRGKKPNLQQSDCENCVNGTYSDNGDVCKPCPAGTESHSLIGSDASAGDWHAWAGTEPHSLEGAADCIVCHGGTYKSSLMMGEGKMACEVCEDGYQPSTNHTFCDECPPGRAGVNGTCELCPDGFRPNKLPQSCTIGNTILNSPVECVGMTGDICEFECEFGFTATGTHRCGLQAFEGGFCAPNDCIEGFEIEHSPTLCAGYLGEECIYTCEAGYTKSGMHMCGPNRAFSGGFCEANPCQNHTSLEHSSTTCSSRTGDVCAYTCDYGYFAAGTHVCGADGVLRGSQCLPSTCTGGTTIPNSPTVCSGSTGKNCLYSCNDGYIASDPHICGSNGYFSGGSCLPRRCTGGDRLHRSGTVCNETARTLGATCAYECNLGSTAQGTHVCQNDGVFSGGSCVPNDCTGGLLITHSISTCEGKVGSRCAFECESGYVAVGTHECNVNGTFQDGQCVSTPSPISCTDGYWLNGTNCTAWAECVPGVTFEVAAPTSSSDRTCSGVSLCAPGLFVLAAPTLTVDTACAPCSSGTFQNFSQQVECPPCEVGKFDHDLDAATECATCLAGTYQLSTGQIECKLCPWETYDHDQDSRTPCVPCDPGFNSTVGRSACRPNTCSSGLTLAHSSTQCSGATHDECDFVCDAGYLAVGKHVCTPSGWFSGGWCARISCVNNTYVERSPTTCTEGTDMQCPISCDEGYSAQGAHVCLANGTFAGGSCTPNPCTEGLTIENSNVTCEGVTGDECQFNCSDGYTVTAAHICDVDGTFKGGSCTKNPPERTFCVRVREGWFGIHGLPFPCPDGWQDIEPEQKGCEPCPSGFAGTNGFCFQCLNRYTPNANSTACLPCPANFGSGPIGICAECPTGFQPNMTETDSLGCMECSSGWAGIDGFCARCAAGSQPNGARSDCSDCPEGMHSTEGVECVTCSAGTRPSLTRASCERCPLGYYGKSGLCGVCSSGHQPHGNLSLCEECPAGFAGKDGLCASCGSGYEPNLARSDCDECAKGRFKTSPFISVADVAYGGSVTVMQEQGLFKGSHLIDGNETSQLGWAFDGGAAVSSPRSAILTFSNDRHFAIHSLRMVSGNTFPSFHVTGLELYSTVDLVPEINGNWTEIYQMEFSSPLEGGVVIGNRAYDECYVAKPVTLRFHTKLQASDIEWNIDDGPMYGNGNYPDNTVLDQDVFVSAGVHRVNYFDRTSHAGGWNGAYFDIFGSDGSYLGGGLNAIQLGIPAPGFNPVSTGTVQFSISEDLVLQEPNCSGHMHLSFHPVIATGLRVDIIDTDISTKTAVVNEIFVYANSGCAQCPDGFGPNSNATSCEQCGENMAGVGGLCNRCPNGQEPNLLHTHCVDCRFGSAGLLGFCIKCAPGRGPNQAKIECVNCTAGRYSVDGEPCQICDTGFGALPDRTECELCPAGHIGVDGICFECASGSEPSGGKDACQNCPPAYAGLEGICNACDVGFEQNSNRTACIECAAGRFRKFAMDWCLTCANGTQPNAIRTQCYDCPLGQAGDLGFCSQCPSGRYPIREDLVALQLDDVLRPTLVQRWKDICAATWMYPPAGFETGGHRYSAALVRRPQGHWSDWLNSTEMALLSQRGRESGPSFLGGTTSLMQAASYGHVSIVQRLLERGVDIHATDSSTGFTAFHFACLNGRADVVDVLVAAGCDTTAKAHNGWIGKDAAEFHGHTAVLQRLFVPPPPAAGGSYVNVSFTSPCLQSSLWAFVANSRRCVPWWDTLQLADATICANCPPATAGVNGRCKMCSPGSAPNEDRTECVQCAAGRVSPTGERCAPCAFGLGSDELQIGCVPCRVGSISVDGVCNECSSGSQPDATRGSCEECPSGRAGIEGTCHECAPGSQVDLPRVSCERCPSGRVKMSNRDLSLDMPHGPVLAIGWVLVKATVWHASDRLKVWVEDGDGGEAVLLDTSLGAGDSSLVEDTWVQMSADVSGMESAAFKISVAMANDHDEETRARRSKMVMFDAFSLVNEVTASVFAHLSFEEPQTAMVGPYIDKCLDLQCLTQHVLLNHPGENAVQQNAPAKMPSWRGFSSSWPHEELGFGTTSFNAAGLLGSCSDGTKYGTQEACEGPDGSPTGHFYIRGNIGVVQQQSNASSLVSTARDNYRVSGGQTSAQAPYLAAHGSQYFLVQDIAGEILVQTSTVFFQHKYTPARAGVMSLCSDGTVGSTRQLCEGALDSPTGHVFTPSVAFAASSCTDGTTGISREICESAGMPNRLRCKLCSDGYGPSPDRSVCDPCLDGASGILGECAHCASGKQPIEIAQGGDMCSYLRPCGAWIERCAGVCFPRRGAFDQHSVGARTRCVTCPRGKAGVDGNCTRCPPGTEPNDAHTECERCACGKVSPTGEACSFCPDGHFSDDSLSTCLHCPDGSYGVGGSCSACPSGEKPNAGAFHGTEVSWAIVPGAGFCTANDNRYEVVESTQVLSWDEAQTQAFEMGGHLATVTSFEEQRCVMAVVDDVSVAAWLGGTGYGPGNWSWLTGEPWSYANWATAVTPQIAPGVVVHAMVNWAGHDGRAHNQSVAQWYSCGSGCPRPRYFVVEYESFDAYTCVGCPWGFAGMDGQCEECPPGFEVGVKSTSCVPCAPGFINPDGAAANVASTARGGTAFVSANLGAKELCNTTFCKTLTDGVDHIPYFGWSTTGGDSAIVAFSGAFPVSNVTITNLYHLKTVEILLTKDAVPSFDGSWVPARELGLWDLTAGIMAGHRLTTTSTGHDTLALYFQTFLATGLRLDVGSAVGPTAIINEVSVSANVRCQICKNGTRVNQNRTSCEACPSNFAGNFGLCSQCSSGQHPNSDQTQCVDCPAGQAGIDGFCVICAPGTQPNSAKTECVQCEYGFYSFIGERCLTCSVGSAAVSRPLCGTLQCPTAEWSDGIMTRFDFSNDLNSFQARSTGPPWKHAARPPGAELNGVMYHAADFGVGTVYSGCLFSSRTLEIQMNFLSVQKVKGSTLKMSLADTVYAFIEMPGSESARSEGVVHALNGAVSNKKTLSLSAPENLRLTWNYGLSLSITLDPWVPIDSEVELGFTFDGGAPNGNPWPNLGHGHDSSDVYIDNLVVTGGVCGIDLGGHNSLGRCICLGGDSIASFGVYSGMDPPNVNTRVGCKTCPAGNIGVAGACHECASSWQPNVQRDECVRCLPGTAGIDGFCIDCGPGHETNEEQTRCVSCPAGKYKPSGLVSCLECWDGAVATEEQTWCLCPPGMSTITEVQVNCDDRGDDAFFASLRVDFPVVIRCDLGCRIEPYEVWGSGPYMEHSSICAAATHATGETGGRFEFRLDAPRRSWAESTRHYVESNAITQQEATQVRGATASWRRGGEPVRGFNVSIPERFEQSCIDHDECATNNGGCDMLTKCTNVAPGRVCGNCPDGYYGPLPQAGWALSGNTSCIAIPREGDQEMLLPEVALEMEGTFEILSLDSPEREDFESRFVQDVADALNVDTRDVVVTRIAQREQVAGRRMQLGLAVPLTVWFTIKTDSPAAVFGELNRQLVNANSILLKGNSTQTIAAGQVIAADDIQLVCLPRTVETDRGSGTCEPCPAGTEFRELRIEQVATDDGLPGLERCIPCPRGKYSEEAGRCKFCTAGTQANNYTRGATGCDSCLDLDVRAYSANGSFCSMCILSQVQSFDGTSCVCEAGRVNKSVRDKPVVCFDEHGFEIGRSLTATVACELCPVDAVGSIVPCIDCSERNSTGAPMPGHWRSSLYSTDVLRCEFGSQACAGGIETLCIPPYAGIACASCRNGHIRTASGCDACPDSVDIATAMFVVALIAFCAVVILAVYLEQRCAIEPALEDALSSAYPRSEVAVVCLRSLISYFQTQAILSRIRAPLPSATVQMLALQTALVDPAAVVDMNRCLPLLPSFDAVYRPPLAAAIAVALALALPAAVFVLGWIMLLVRRCCHPKPVTAKAASIFKKFDSDHDGLLKQQDISRLAKRTRTQNYDDEAWADWCAVLKANPEKGISLHAFERLFLLKGPDGAQELDSMFAALFPTPQAESEDKAIRKFYASAAVLRDCCISAAAVAFYIVHPTASAWLMSLFACETVLDDMAVLRADRGIQCYTRTWVVTTFGYGLPVLYALCLILPASAALSIRNAAQHRTLEELKSRAGFIVRGYRPQKALWEIVVSARKLALAWTVLFLDAYGPAVQAVATVGILQAGLVMHVVHHPHTATVPHNLELATIIMSGTTALAATFHTQLQDIEYAADCAASPLGDTRVCGLGAETRPEAVLIALVTCGLNAIICGVSSTFIWHGCAGKLRKRWFGGGGERTGHGPQSLVATQRMLRAQDKGEVAATAEQLRTKALSVMSAAKTCDTFKQRLTEMQADMPELEAEIGVIGGAVMRLESLVSAAGSRTEIVQKHWSRGELRRKLRTMKIEGAQPDEQWVALFRKYDKDQSGSLELEEFRRAVRLDAKVSRAALSDEEIAQVFDWVDVDRGGSISAPEFEAFLVGKDESGDLDDEAGLLEAEPEETEPRDVRTRKGQGAMAAVKYSVSHNSGGAVRLIGSQTTAGKSVRPGDSSTVLDSIEHQLETGTSRVALGRSPRSAMKLEVSAGAKAGGLMQSQSSFHAKAHRRIKLPQQLQC